MALTSMLKDINLKELFRGVVPDKNAFKTTVGYEAFSEHYPVIVPYKPGNRFASFVAGISFGYVTKLMLAHSVKENKNLVFENLGADRVLLRLDLLKIFGCSEESLVMLEEKFLESLELCKKFVYDEIEDYRVIIPCTIYFAQLKFILSSGHTYRTEYKYLLERKEDIELEVERLSDVFIMYSLILV